MKRQIKKQPLPYRPDTKLLKIYKTVHGDEVSQRYGKEYAEKYGVHETDLALCVNCLWQLRHRKTPKRKWLERANFVYNRVRAFHAGETSFSA